VAQEYSEGLELEDFDIDIKKELETIDLNILERITGGPLLIMDDAGFKELCSDDYLPLIARNNLENGRSKNLWHEQVVPRESRFYFMVLKPGNQNSTTGNDKAADLEFDDTPVQIGGNASIGYGFTIIREVGKLIEEPSEGRG